MEELFRLLLNSGVGLSFVGERLLQLDRSMPKADFLALLLLSRRGEATMNELAADLKAPLSTVTGIVNRLVNKGLLARERDQRDRRAIMVRLTPAGSDLAGDASSHLQELFAAVERALTPAELELLWQLVRKILGALLVHGADESQVEAERAPRRIVIED